MTQRTSPPFRAEHVGSLLRPHDVTKARGDRAAGRIDAAALRAIEDKAIAAAVRRQEEIGLMAVTDGELRRQTWHMDFYNQIGGLERVEEPVRLPFKNEQGEVPVVLEGVRVADRLRLSHTIFGDDFSFLKATAKATPKLTIPSPSVLHRRGGRLLDPAANPAISRLYTDREQFWHDLAAVYAAEIAALSRLGCTYLQIDDTSWASLCDPALRQSVTRLGEDGEHIHLTYIKLFNDAVAAKPAGMTIATHTCRGNFKSAWAAEGAYDFIAEPLFGSLAADVFFLEYDDARSGGFAPLRFVPKGKMVVLGLVTTKKGVLETKDLLKRRIDEAAKYVPLDQLCLSPQCGFSSTIEGNVLSPEEQWQKLRLVVETAREVWG
ncbi:MAG TPA: 5-methyltetrahydropteroyltriglutamate--homocysteine S-methyltransferase [Stellaceae bacterium]|nr:5-methyltetrahydropteroyltriglutamate--homocysteine S-methyltransferase [Stellaceae bacterium]